MGSKRYEGVAISIESSAILVDKIEHIAEIDHDIMHDAVEIVVAYKPRLILNCRSVADFAFCEFLMCGISCWYLDAKIIKSVRNFGKRRYLF